jgi:hypothetical protein
VVTNATGTATNSIAKYLIRGDARGCISLWSLNNTSQNLLDGGGGVQKKCNYEVSLAKFWTENCKQDSENVINKIRFLRQRFIFYKNKIIVFSVWKHIHIPVFAHH